MDWLSFGNQFDHHSVMIVNGERLGADELVSSILPPTYYNFSAFP